MGNCGKVTPANWLVAVNRGMLAVTNSSDTSSLAIDGLSLGSVVEAMVVLFEQSVGPVE